MRCGRIYTNFETVPPTESRRYLRLQHRLSEYVKNEVRRVINRVI